MLSRHLNETQRASVAAKLANMQSGANPGNSNAVKNKNKSANLQNSFVSQTQAADMLNVSERSVATAKKVQEEAIPDLELLLKCAEVKVKDKETRCLELREIFPEVDGKRTRDLVAEKSGFGNGKTYQQAKKAQEEARCLELQEKFPEVDGKETRCLELQAKWPEVKGRQTRDLVAEKSGFVGILAVISLFLYAFLGSKFLNPAYLLHRHRLVRHKVKDKEKNGLGTCGQMSTS